jgi:hypothetical protein
MKTADFSGMWPHTIYKIPTNSRKLDMGGYVLVSYKVMSLNSETTLNKNNILEE